MALGRFIEEDIDLHNFRTCDRLLRDSKIDEALSAAIAAKNRGRTGRPSQNPYTVRAVVMAQLLAVASPGPTTMRRMVDILWHLSPGQLDVIGMTGRITSERRHQMAVSPAAATHITIMRR